MAPLQISWILALWGLFPPPATAAPSSATLPPVPVADSAILNGQGRGAQARFERSKALHAPLTWSSYNGPCDERLGRFCLTLGRDDDEDSGEWDEWIPPPEDERVTREREELLELLSRIGEAHPGDRWILEQRVAYLVESGRRKEALELARDCRIAPDEAWRCPALEGLVLHTLSRFPEAEEAFERALAGMPPEVAREWRDPEVVSPRELRDLLRGLDEEETGVIHRRIWTLSDPLYLVPGNDRWTEHLARWTLALIRSDARNAYQMRWGDDLTDLLVRYGPEVAFERQRSPTLTLSLGPTPVVGRMGRNGRGVLPEVRYAEDPAAIPIGEWRLNRRTLRERHSPSYAPRIGALQVQQARFRRAGELLLVVGWELPGGGGAGAPAGNPTSGGTLPEAGLFLQRVSDLALREGLVTFVDRAPAGGGSGSVGGVATARVAAGDYVVSMEALDGERLRAWRARHGVSAPPPSRGVPALSDLLLLTPAPAAQSASAEEPEGGRLEDHLGRVLPGGRLAVPIVEVAWEVYEVEGAGAVLRYELTAEPADRGLLLRAAEFLRLTGPPAAVEIGWEEGVPLPPRGTEPGTPGFRRVALDLSALPAGTTRIVLTLHLPGREPIRVERLVELPG